MAKVTYKRERKRPGCLFFIMFTVMLILGLTVLTKYTSFSILPNSFEKPAPQYGKDEFPQLEEVWSYGKGSNKVVRIPLSGMITLQKSESIFNSQSSATEALLSIKRATLDKDVLAIILDIDSGGGGITASDIIYNALLDFKRSNNKRKIVALYGDMAASGAYYISLAADHIIARPTSITGSIGVIIPSVNFAGLVTKYGIKDASIKSGDNKDLLNPLTEPNPQQTEIIQDVVNKLYDRFVSLVAKQRNLPENEVRPIADGRIFTAAEAQRLKLIDEIGYWDDAMTRTAELLGVDNIKVYRYQEQFSFSDLLRSGTSINPKAWLQQSSPRLQYRYTR
jgi:protease-4